jgi:hypothetical protein
MDRYGNDITNDETVALKMKRHTDGMIRNEVLSNTFDVPYRMIERETETLDEKVGKMNKNLLSRSRAVGSGKKEKVYKCSCGKNDNYKETTYKKQVPIIGGSNVEMADDLPPERKIGGSKKVVEGSQQKAPKAAPRKRAPKTAPKVAVAVLEAVVKAPKAAPKAAPKKRAPKVAKVDTGKPARKPTEWQKLLTSTMKKKSMTMKQAIQHIKDNNLYKKKSK